MWITRVNHKAYHHPIYIYIYNFLSSEWKERWTARYIGWQNVDSHYPELVHPVLLLSSRNQFFLVRLRTDRSPLVALLERALDCFSPPPSVRTRQRDSMTISRANYRLSRFSFADRERKERKESGDGEEWSIRFFSSRRGVERRVDKHSEDSRSNQTLRRRSRRTGGRVFKVKHLERRLKARLALDALDCLIFRLRAVLRVAGKNTRETVATRFSRAILQSQSLEHRDESSFDTLSRPRKSFLRTGPRFPLRSIMFYSGKK